LASLGADPLARAYAALLFVALLVKAGSFPFYFWLPVTYPVLPPATQALFAGLMTKVGAYALLRVVGEIYAGGAADLLVGLGWIAAATMVLGVLGAAYHYDTRRILAFHSVSQIGYILLAISLGTRAGFAAAMFFVIHHIVVKANLFLVGGLMEQFGGSFDLRKTGGLHSRAPIVAVLFAISASALVGIPPLSGFWAKMLVVRESFALGHGFFGVLALGVGGLTLFSMAKVWIEAFWKPHPADDAAPKSPPAPRALVACGALAFVAVLLGIVPEPIVAYLDAAVAGMGYEGTK
jgi:multicomponent Na+:H+ antiporter subunit D